MTAILFPPEDVNARRKLIRWARILLIGHGLITGVSLWMGWWMVPVVVTLAPAYGKWLQFLCNESQHIGLQDKVADFRLCCRTIYLNPFLRFLYWHMNYHTEHHMYAAVPCYNLRKLHQSILPEMPPSPHGLVQPWRSIADILQHTDTCPTTPENFVERKNAMYETGRCLSWAGVKHEGDFQQAVTELTRAVDLHTAGKLEEACRQMDQGIRLLDKVLRDLGIYDELRAPGQ